MKKYLYYLLLMVLATISCSPKNQISEIRIPPNIIPPDTMIRFIADLQYTEAVLREYNRHGQDNDVRTEKYMMQLFEKHHLSPERYKQSIAFYEQNQDVYYEIYKDVVSRLTQLQSEIKTDEDE